MRILGRLLVRLVTLVVILSVVGFVVGFFLVRRSFPTIDGEVRVSGLDAPVTVIRDSNGIPHIYAETEHDLFVAQGYVHAQDRFWQMDFWRHIGQGRLSELFGESQLETDLFLRTLGFGALAAEEYAMLDDQARAVLDAYAEGVNAYLDERSGTRLSFEYGVLALQTRGYEPDPWDPIDTLSWAKMMSWDLGGNMDFEIERAVLAGSFTTSQVEELFPAFPDDHPVIVPDSLQPAASAERPGFVDPSVIALFEGLAGSLARVDALLGEGGPEIGSNNWVIAGSRTSTGMPLLANDPHLSIQMPSIWYEIGLHCDGSCPFDVAGFSFAGVPGVIIGHNERIAWGVTNLGPDVQDLYIEKVNPDNPNQYEVDGQWVDFEVRKETIEIAGKPSRGLDVLSTPHGPVITDVYGKLEDFNTEAGINIPPSYAVALRWTALEPARLVQAVLGINRAQNWDEFREALRFWDVPSQNFVYADVDGNIGYQAPGNIPIRSKGDGRWPVPGWTGEYEWTGYVPFDELPSAFNPAQGFLATANQAVVGDGYRYLLGTDWAYGYRADRIVDVLAGATEPIDTAFIAELQRDARNLSAEIVVPYLLDLRTSEPVAGRAQALLERWADSGSDTFDDSYQMRADLPGAALYASVWRNLLALTFHDDLPERFWPDGGSRWFEVFRNLLADPNNAWWDWTGTSDVEARDEMLERALLAAMRELEDRLGDDPAEWEWGDLHTATFRNATFGDSGIPPIEWLFNRGRFHVDGSSSVVNAMGWDAGEGYEIVAIPSMRMIVDLQDFGRSRTVHPTGQSGHIYHSHYIDMADRWAVNDLHPMHWERAAIEADAEGTLVLKP
jgi:penicillin amidase